MKCLGDGEMVGRNALRLGLLPGEILIRKYVNVGARELSHDAEKEGGILLSTFKLDAAFKQAATIPFLPNNRTTCPRFQDHTTIQAYSTHCDERLHETRAFSRSLIG